MTQHIPVSGLQPANIGNTEHTNGKVTLYIRVIAPGL